MRTLHLTLYRRWFDEIAAGTKREEYRAMTPHWIDRLDGPAYDVAEFRNGYSAAAPSMRVEIIGLRRHVKIEGVDCYAIQLGRILEIKNYSGPKE